MHDQLDAETIEAALCEKIRFMVEPDYQEIRIYLDSFDWRLFANNNTLELHQHGGQRKLILRSLGNSTALAQTLIAQQPTFSEDLPPGRLRDEVAPLLEMRELQPLLTVKAKMRCLRMLNKDEKTIARVVIEASSLQTRKGSRARRLDGRVILLPVRGYQKPAEKIANLLDRLQLRQDEQEPLLTLLSIADITPDNYSSKLKLKLDPQMRSDQATRIILHRLLDIILLNEAGTRTGTDTEFLHDFRVAVRRTRSALGQIKGVLPQPVLNRFRREFAWLGRITGNTRDLDVYLLNFDDYKYSLPASIQDDIDPLHDFLQRHWHIEHKALVRALDSARYRRLVESWRSFLGQPVKQRSTLPNARQPVYETACKRIWRVYRRILREGNAIKEDSPAEALHDLRKTAKKLRYLMEFFQSLFPVRKIKQLIGILKDLQNNLGDFQDFEVQVITLRQFSRQMVDEGLGSAETLLAMGMLIDGLETRQQLAREAFDDRFRSFSLPENQAHFRAMFAESARKMA